MAVPAPKAPQKIDAPEELMELSDWWQKHGNAVSTVILVIALAVLGARWWTSHQKARAEQASAAAATAASIEDLEKVVGEFPGSADAPIALLKIAAENCRQNQFDIAKEKYTSFLKKYAGHALAPVAKLGIAFTDEANGAFDDALAVYEEFIGSAAKGDYLIPVATLGKARCLALQGKPEEARTILDQMIADNSQTIWVSQADDLKAALSQMKFVKPAAFDDLLNTAIEGAKAEPAPEVAPAVETAESSAEPAPEAAPAVETAELSSAEPAPEAAPAAEEAAAPAESVSPAPELPSSGTQEPAAEEPAAESPAAPPSGVAASAPAE